MGYGLWYGGYKFSAGRKIWGIGVASGAQTGMLRYPAPTGFGESRVWEKLGTGAWDDPDECVNSCGAGGPLEPSVVYDPVTGEYLMWYAAWGKSAGLQPTCATPEWGYRIGLLTSTDGVTWAPKTESGAPVFEPRIGKWDCAVVSHVNVVRDPVCGYHLFYAGATSAGGPTSIGHAWTPDGLTYYRTEEPVVDPPTGFDRAGGPSAYINSEGKPALYYMAGNGNFTNAQIRHASFATCSPTPE